MKQYINLENFAENPFTLIGNEWMLITAGNSQKCNTMTASYGTVGILFGKPVAQIYVRPERFTYRFLEQHPYFSLSFFAETYRKKLQYCGKVSGREENKIDACGFTTLFDETGVPYFGEAKLTLICRKLYAQDLNAALLFDEKIKQEIYTKGGVHRMYVGEITNIFSQD